MSLDPIAQSQLYHNFADQRSFRGIPNFWDVVSNLPFALFGLLGLSFSLKQRQSEAPLSWILFFVGVSLVAVGSSYYHLNPDNNSLVWDRLPMTIAFMALFVGLLSEYVNPRFEKRLLLPAIIIGISSVLYWHISDDLRFYAWIQLAPLLTILSLLILFRSRYTHIRYLFVVLALYLLAKVTETYDKEIFTATFEQFSGHSLKHLLATMGTFSLYLYMRDRVRN